MTDEIKNHYGRPLPPLLPEKIDGLSESMNAFLHATSEKLHVDEALPSRVCNSADPRTEQEKAVTGAAPTKDPKWHAALETPKGKFYSTDGNWYETFDEALRNDYDATEKKLQQQQAWAAQEKAERADEAAREQLALAKEIAALHQPPYVNANEVYMELKQKLAVGGMGPNMTASPDGHVPSTHGPEHYKLHQFEPIDVIETFKLNYNLANAIKYILRADHKGEKVRDLEKAIAYLTRELTGRWPA